MIKKYLVILIFCSLPFLGISQADRNIDSTAVFILDKMADTIGELESVSFYLETTTDRRDDSKKIRSNYSVSHVTMNGPNNLVFQKSGNNGRIGFWYDGFYASYYSFDENNYVTLEAPDNTVEMIDEMYLRFGFQFPAADFFYPSFTDDILEGFHTLEFLGKTVIDGEECYYIRALNDEMNFQLWVSSSNWNLPKRFVILQKGEQTLRIESVFNKWELNPTIPTSVFEFLPPKSAKLIDILEKS